jgi:hypothetical protein
MVSGFASRLEERFLGLRQPKLEVLCFSMYSLLMCDHWVRKIHHVVSLLKECSRIMEMLLSRKSTLAA